MVAGMAEMAWQRYGCLVRGHKLGLPSKVPRSTRAVMSPSEGLLSLWAGRQVPRVGAWVRGSLYGLDSRQTLSLSLVHSIRLDFWGFGDSGIYTRNAESRTDLPCTHTTQNSVLDRSEPKAHAGDLSDTLVATLTMLLPPSVAVGIHILLMCRVVSWVFLSSFFFFLFISCDSSKFRNNANGLKLAPGRA